VGDSETCRIVFVDLDGTLWDHEDVSQMKPPFRKIGEGVITDSHGSILRVREDMLKILSILREEGVLLSTLSWNDPDIALQALQELGLRDLFHYHAIEFHPRKDLMAEKALAFFASRHGCKDFKIVYIDDRDIHFKDFKERYPRTCFIMAWKDFAGFEEGLEKVKKCL